jgi:hypothetical protein
LHILITLGIILIVIEAIPALLGSVGHTISPRRHYW